MNAELKTELVTIDETTALDVFTKPNGLEVAISQIEKTARSIVPDVTTDKGRKEIRSAAAKIASGKVKLDNLGKTVAADAKATVKLIDGNRRIVRDRLDALKAEIRAPLTDFENAEKERVAVIKNKIQQIESLAVIYDEHGDALDIHILEANLRLLNKYTVNKEMFDEFRSSAQRVKDTNIAALEEFVEREKERLAKDAELDRLRKEAEERKKQEHEAELKRKAAEDARLEAERKAREDSARIEMERQAAVKEREDAKRQAAAAEKARIADAEAAEHRRLADIEEAKQAEIARQEREAAKKLAEDNARAADLNHANEIRLQAGASLMDVFHIDDNFAADIVAAIHDGKIANVSISY